MHPGGRAMGLPITASLACETSEGLLLLVGAGNVLRAQLWEAAKGTKVAETQVKVLPAGGTVLSLHKDGGTVWAVGDRSLCQLHLSLGTASVTLSPAARHHEADFITAALPNTSSAVCSTQIALLSAHNRISWLGHDRDGFNETHSVKGAKQCLLSTGKLAMRCGELWCFGGTWFGRLVVWCPSRGPELVCEVADDLGPVFDLCISTDLSQLYSVSDDRCLRVWPLDLDSWTPLTSPSKRGWGHEARPWRVAEVSGECLATTGEDGRVCLWLKAGAELRLWKVQEASAASVRCLSPLASWRGGRALLLGDDGGGLAVLRLPEGDGLCADYQRVEGEDVAIAVFRGGSVELVGKARAAKESIVGVARSGEEAYSLSRHGDVVRLSDGTNVTPPTLKSSVLAPFRSICVTSTSPRLLLLSSAGSSRFALFAEGSTTLTLSSTNAKDRHGTYATCTAADVDRGLVVVGDSGGTLRLYQIDRDGRLVSGESTTGQAPEQEAQGVHPIATKPRVHGGAGVTDVAFHSFSPDGARLLLSIGRDGRLVVWEVDKSQGPIVLRQLHAKHRMGSMDWPGRFVATGEGLRVAGFAANRFVLVEPWSGRSEMALECGGGHRPWDFKDDKLLLVKRGHAFVASSHRWIQDELTPSVASKELLSLVALDEGGWVLGGEDGSLRILGTDGSLEALDDSAHSSSITALATLNCERFVSGGGRSFLQVWRKDSRLPFPVHMQTLKLSGDADARVTSVVTSEGLILAAASDASLTVFSEAPSGLWSLSSTSRGPEGLRGWTAHLAAEGNAVVGASTGGSLWLGRLGRGRLDIAILLADFAREGLSSVALSSRAGEPVELHCWAGGESGCVYVAKATKDTLEHIDSKAVHASTVTGLCPQGDTVVSVGLDQRLAKLRLDERKVELVNVIVTNVADPAAVACQSDRSILLAGVGIQPISEL